MKFLESLKSRKLSKTLAAVAAGGMLMFGSSSAMAAPNNSDAMFAFRNAYVSAPPDTRNFRESITFFGTTFHADIEAQGNILRDASLRIGGNMNWEYTNPKTKRTLNFNIPFYVAQTGANEMIVYIQRGGTWYKFALPGISVGFANTLKSNDVNVLQKNLDNVKDVKIFRDDATQQIFNVTLDGKKVAQMLQGYEQGNNANVPKGMVTENQEFTRNLINALQTTDILTTWTFDKRTKETLTVNVDFTDLMRAYAKSVLNESAAGKIVLSEEERDLMDAIGYYSEFHAATSSIGVNPNANISPSTAAQNAKTNDKVLNDVLGDMTTAVEVKK